MITFLELYSNLDELKKVNLAQRRKQAIRMKRMTKSSLASIGSQIGKRDHATVLHACKTVA